MSPRKFKTRLGRVAKVQMDYPWKRRDFAYLGTIEIGDGRPIGWAWHADGTSVDTTDRGFDLIDFPVVGDAAVYKADFKPLARAVT